MLEHGWLTVRWKKYHQYSIQKRRNKLWGRGSYPDDAAGAPTALGAAATGAGGAAAGAGLGAAAGAGLGAAARDGGAVDIGL